MMLSIALLSLIWDNGAAVPAGRAYPAGFAGFFATDTSFDWLPVAYGAAPSVVTTNYWYDISANSWDTMTSGPTPARYDCAGTFATLSGEKQLFVFAGSGGTYPAYNTAFRYRYSTNSWTTITNFPYQAEGLMAAGEIGGMIYTFGGHNSSDQWTPPTVTNATYRYSPSGNSYTPRADMPQARSEGGCAIARNENGDSCIYIISGIYRFDNSTGEPYYTSRTDEYNPRSNSWRNRANFPGTQVSGASAATLRNEIYVMGGYNYWSGDNPTTIYVYNPATDSWVSGAAHTPAVPNLPEGRDGGVATAPDFPLRGIRLISPANNDTCCADTLFWRRGTGAVKIVFATGGDAANNVYTTTWRLRSVVQGYVLKYDTLANFATASVIWNDLSGSGTDDVDTAQIISSMNVTEDHWYYWTVGVVDEMPDTAWSQDTFRFYYDCQPAHEGTEESTGGLKPYLENVFARGPDVLIIFVTPQPGTYSLKIYDSGGRLALVRELSVEHGRNQLPVWLPGPGVYMAIVDGQGINERARIVVTGR